MTSSETPTGLAPPERAPEREIRRQSKEFSAISFLREILNAVPNIVLVLNKERQVIFANKPLLEFLGRQDPSTVAGMRPGEVFDCIHARETQGGCGTTEFCRTCGTTRAILTSQKGQPDVQECRIVQKQTGGALDLRVWASPLQLKGRQFTVYAASDVGHENRRKALERIFFKEVLDPLGKLRETAKALDQVGGGEPEALRDTMHALVDRLFNRLSTRGDSRTASDVLRKEILTLLSHGEIVDETVGQMGPEFARKQDLRTTICRLSDELMEEINAQRLLTAAENNELSVNPTPIDSIAFLKEIVGFFKNHEATKDRRVRIADGAREVMFVSDQVLLKRLLGNMVKNALEASSADEPVTLGCEVVSDKVEFWVHNPNPMPEEVQRQVFQRSFSTKGEGRGLGTYAIRLLSERCLKGSVSFRTSQIGTTFVARYPLAFE